MQITPAAPTGRAGPLDETLGRALSAVNGDDIRRTVAALAFPRPYSRPDANAQARDIIVAAFARLGFQPTLQGASANVVAGDPAADTLIAAHYDSVPGTAGADDNASAVAVLLAAAEVIGPARRDVCFAAFNAEEDGFRGSSEFAASLGARRPRIVHVLEMVGYTDARPGSQANPLGPALREFPDRGDFLGLLADHRAAAEGRRILGLAGDSLPGFPVYGLLLPDIPLHTLPGVLFRSDHVPFWQAGIPAMMWTDTAEYRNPNYHSATDAPETLDYGFMVNVTRLLVMAAHSFAKPHRD